MRSVRYLINYNTYKFLNKKSEGTYLLLLDTNLGLHIGRQSFDHFGLHLVHLPRHLADHLVHGGLVVQVKLGQGEDANPGEDDQGKGIEPRPNVGQHIQTQAKLQGINRNLQQKEALGLGQSLVDYRRDTGGVLLDGRLGQRQWHAGGHSERVEACVHFPHLDHEEGVDLDSSDGSEKHEGGVGDDREEGGEGEAEEDCQYAAEQWSSHQRLFPVDERCGRESRDGSAVRHPWQASNLLRSVIKLES